MLAAVASGRRVGTRFAPSERRESAFKLWLRYAKPSLGTIRVDAGAASALRRQGTSAAGRRHGGRRGVGVGDAIDVVDDQARAVGRASAPYAADDLRQVAGLKTDAVRRVLPDAGAEVIHRDQFVLADPPAAP